MSYIPHIAWLSPPSFSPSSKPIWGYQQRPCLCTPAPGGSDRYSLSVAARPFCIRKAILIHGPINTHTSGLTSAAPPRLFGCGFFFCIFSSSCPLRQKNSCKVLDLSVDQWCARLRGRNNEGSLEGCISYESRGLIVPCFISCCQSCDSQAKHRKNGTQLCVSQITRQPIFSILKAPSAQYIKYWS